MVTRIVSKVNGVDIICQFDINRFVWEKYSSQTQQQIRTFSAYFPFPRCEPLSLPHLILFKLIFLIVFLDY
jgi:hypothetical protein